TCPDNRGRRRARQPTPPLAPLASAFLALGPPHEVLRRLDTQLLALFVADRRGFTAATAAHALLGRATDHPLDPRQFRRQCLAARMVANSFLRWSRRQRFACTLVLHLGGAHSRLQFQQFQLLVGQFLTPRTIHLDALQPQPLFQYLDL